MEEVGWSVAVNDNANIVRFLMLGLFLYLDCRSISTAYVYVGAVAVAVPSSRASSGSTICILVI